MSMDTKWIFENVHISLLSLLNNASYSTLTEERNRRPRTFSREGYSVSLRSLVCFVQPPYYLFHSAIEMRADSALSAASPNTPIEAVLDFNQLVDLNRVINRALLNVHVLDYRCPACRNRLGAPILLWDRIRISWKQFNRVAIGLYTVQLPKL